MAALTVVPVDHHVDNVATAAASGVALPGEGHGYHHRVGSSVVVGPSFRSFLLFWLLFFTGRKENSNNEAATILHEVRVPLPEAADKEMMFLVLDGSSLLLDLSFAPFLCLFFFYFFFHLF